MNDLLYANAVATDLEGPLLCVKGGEWDYSSAVDEWRPLAASFFLPFLGKWNCVLQWICSLNRRGRGERNVMQ